MISRLHCEITVNIKSNLGVIVNLRESPMPNEIILRDVTESDLPILFEHQLDLKVTMMAVSCGSN